ncbi:MAG TPA: acyl-CoA dehydrogenase family protein [bacterium]|nr:acyl-CoA dehydrogenase family protein [bacterium]
MFSIELTPEQRLIREMTRKFCARELEPVTDLLDEHKMLPYDIMKKFLHEIYGTGALQTVEDLNEYKKSGESFTRALITIEAAKVCPGFCLTMGASLELAGYAISFIGAREQIERWALPIYRGDKIGAWGLTEPDAGSDVQSLKTTARPDGGHYVLNGQKTFISNAPFADVMVIYAKAPAGISAFVVERGMEGLTTSEPFDKMGHRASPTGAIYMEDVRVPRSHLLGEEGKGFWYALNNLNHERAHTPTLMIGIMERCLEEAVKFAKERVQFGKPIIRFQGIQFMLARMWQKLLISYSLLFTLAQMEEKGLDISATASAAKLYSTESATSVALDAIQIMGGYGYMKEYKVERFMRDAKLMEIGAGTSQIQMMIMARQLMKMDPLELSPLFAGPSPFAAGPGNR